MWLNRLASVRGGGSRPASAPAAEVASTSAAAPPAAAAAAAPSPSSQAKAEAAKKYIENMYKERGKAATDRLERRRSLDNDATAVRRLFASSRRGPLRRQSLTDDASRPQLSEEERSAALAELQRRETEYTRLRRQKLTVDDFEPLTIIGRGAFGEVRPSRRGALALKSSGPRPNRVPLTLTDAARARQVRIVRERATGNVFAMKKLKKSEMVRRGQARASSSLPLAPPLPRGALRRVRVPFAPHLSPPRRPARPACVLTRCTAALLCCAPRGCALAG